MQTNLFKYVVKGGEALAQGDAIPQLVVDFEYLKRATTAKEVVRLIETNKDISWELIPTQFLKDKDVLTALLPTMGLTAVIRQLGKLTAAGVLDPMSANQKLVVSKLSDIEAIKGQRLHPISILQSLKQYSAGHGEKGSLVWTPNQNIVDSLNDAFYAAFGTLEKTDAGQYIAIDVSGSMSWDTSKVNGSPNLYARDVAACMAMAIARTTSNYFIGAFSGEIQEMKISPSMRLDSVLKEMSKMRAGSTDCSLPMLDAAKKRMSGVDLFTVITDNETYAGRMQPVQALREYRNAFNKSAKLCVMATSVSNFTIADPKDAGMLDIAGFDSAAPQIIADFASKR
jgi:60 kDa SS-A/Ro ribonucleoprotein